jgi:hypothetical protein
MEGNIKGKLEENGKRGRRRKQLLDGRKEYRRYWKLKLEGLALKEAMDLSIDRLRHDDGGGDDDDDDDDDVK